MPEADTRRAVLRLAVVLVTLQAVFLALLVSAQAVPDDPIVDHLLEAVEDGTYPSNLEPDNMGGTSSSFTECITVGTGLGRPELSPWERAIRMPRISNCAEGPDDLRRLQRGESLGDVEEYFRYWAGWTVVTRPVLALWGLEALRRLSGALLVLSGVAALVVVARRTTAAFAVGLILPFLLASNAIATPTSSVEQALSFAAAFASVAATAWGAGHGLRGAALGAIVGAAIYSYIGDEEQPARAVQQEEPQRAPSVAERVQVRCVRLAPVRVERDRHLGDAGPREARADDHLGGRTPSRCTAGAGSRSARVKPRIPQ